MNTQKSDPGSDLLADIDSVPGCITCGSEHVTRAALACWNPGTGLWELEKILEPVYCNRCEAETTLRWDRKDAVDRTRVRELNDLFRTKGRGNGTVLITSGVQAFGDGFVRRAVAAVQAFDTFTEDVDPWGEHDFGAFDLDGQKLFWKIDAYDLTMTMGSPNPANEAVTKRVLTILLASEY